MSPKNSLPALLPLLSQERDSLFSAFKNDLHILKPYFFLLQSLLGIQVRTICFSEIFHSAAAY